VTGAITAVGIRDGDPGVLRALVERRGAAVLAFCEVACAPGTALAAAGDAFARFRGAVIDAERPSELDPETLLLSATRQAAAARMPVPEPVAAGGLGRLFTGGRDATADTSEAPALLADRADGLLAPDEEVRLTRLLDASSGAREADDRLRAAEHAYRAAPAVRLPPTVIDGVVAAILGEAAAVAAPATEAFAPVPPRPAPAPLDAEQRTVEWALPAAELGDEPAFTGEVAAARLGGDADGAGRPPGLPRTPATAPERASRRGALAPAAAVIVAALGTSLVAGGAFGDEPVPPLDTGIVPAQTASRVPEGQAAGVVRDLRAAADAAAEERTAAREAIAPAPAVTPDPATAGDGTTGADDPAGDGTTTDGTSGAGAGDAPAPAEPAAPEAPAAPEPTTQVEPPDATLTDPEPEAPTAGGASSTDPAAP